jgi:hypothetical protein
MKNIFHISLFIVTFAPELTWTDLNCLQPREKMLKLIYFLSLAIRHKSPHR